VDLKMLKRNFSYHAPTSQDAIKLYDDIRQKAKDFAEYINSICPEGREQSLAITHLEETVFWANASIARKG